jgi:hypothetical protein
MATDTASMMTDATEAVARALTTPVTKERGD